ncbi:flagellar motor switch protein FliM [Rhodothermus marinus SG0.5JP17-172]|uniref:flagellar motor switch protein FliM n=1 Tax=Rhodothermus marinus TaxID=29549 RepID=UPI000223D90C|nr:flagellar motor switch protein FliM [Rhodothermus marinus]AEN74016.1 flagellar motor switch protein FliM [Rhodothermus marinus SG0.5JP17-172]MBO2491007.1 flagellar motor switch protein FliM [Rhodothermus marinus]
MAKPLSQEEIDILLQVRSQIGEQGEYDLEALESMMTAEAEKKILPYNFKRPRLFSQDQMRVLHYVHEAFARDLSVYLSAQLRTLVDLSLSAIDQVLYSEFVMSSAPPSALYIVEVQPLHQRIVFELDPRLAIYTVEKLFGGPGIFLRKPRELSQIERRIMDKVMMRAFRELEKAWKQIHELHLEEVGFESNAEFVQILPGVEPALVATFEVSIYEQRSFINICYPYILLERILGHSAMKQWRSSSTTEVPPAVRQRYEEQLEKIEVELRAVMGRTWIKLSELMTLEVGDVLVLERRVNQPVQVYIGEREKFRAIPGRSGKHRALRILEVVPPELPLEEDALESDASAA